MSNEISKLPEDMLALANEYGADSGAGLENVSSSDLSIPFLRVLQQLSPECKPVKQGGLDGAEPGMLLNSVTQELYDGEKGIVIVPALTEHLYIEWMPDRGGFVAAHAPTSPVAQKYAGVFGKIVMDNGNILQETFQIYAVVLDDVGENPTGSVLIPFSSSKIKVYKNIISRIHSIQIRAGEGRKITPPLFAHRLRITTLFEKNPKGEFHNIVIGSFADTLVAGLIPTSHDGYIEAKNLRDIINKGKMRVDYGGAHDENDVGNGENGAF